MEHVTALKVGLRVRHPQAIIKGPERMIILFWRGGGSYSKTTKGP